MGHYSRLKLYYDLFLLTVKNSRITPKKIAKRMEYSGRGRSPSTLLWHMKNMYEKNISKPPQITLKSFEKAQICTFFCKRTKNLGLFNVLTKIDNDPDITYAVALSSKRFFITTRKDTINVNQYGLTVKEQSRMYTPVYTIPKGWNIPVRKALLTLLEGEYKKGIIPRTLHYHLDWNTVDWKIYHSMKKNVRVEFTAIAKKVGCTSVTVKNHFYNRILPKCTTINFFFPQGYDSYRQAFLKVKTDFESSLINAFSRLPCTTYVFPLEKELIVGLFYENIKDVIFTIGKMEEKAIIDDYLLYSPLACTV